MAKKSSVSTEHSHLGCGSRHGFWLASVLLTIAQRFNAGKSEHKNIRVPSGTTGASQTNTVLSSRMGLWSLLSSKPSVETLGYCQRKKALNTNWASCLFPRSQTLGLGTHLSEKFCFAAGERLLVNRAFSPCSPPGQSRGVSICLAFNIENAVHSKAAEHCRTPRPAGHYALISRHAFWSAAVLRRFPMRADTSLEACATTGRITDE
jgi:hypothetical protein